MRNLDYQNNSQDNKNSRIYTKRHYEIIDALERLLEQGVPDLTMSEMAKKLKISLRTLSVSYTHLTLPTIAKV